MEIVLLAVLVLALAYIQAPVILWTSAIGVGLVLTSVIGTLSFFTLSIFWLLFIIATLFVFLKNQRQRYFTRPLLKFLYKRMPSISESERIAIESGDVWWEKELFSGRPQWKKLLSMPLPRLTSEEQAFLDNQVETLCNLENDWRIVNDLQNLPEKMWNYLKQERFFGLVIPKEYGGHGFSALAHSTIVTKIATHSLTLAIDMMVPNSLGPGELLLHYGTTEQKEYYLPRLARGEEIPCFALTSPEAGSDAGSITDRGIICYEEYEGKKILGMRLNWTKRYITLAPIATLLGLAFRLYDPENLLGDKVDLGITLCLLPTSHPGVEIGHRHYPLRLAFLNGPTRGQDVFVPLDWIIGGVEKIGQGWKMLMECLSIGRAISLPALSSACGQLCYRATGAYARLRKQFNLPIAQFEGVEEALSHIAGLTYLLESTRLLTAGAVDQNVRPAIASAIAKYHMTEMARKVMDAAMDVHGGHGIQAGPRNFLALAYTAIPVGITVEGANILTRNLIIFGQGVIRCHPYLLKEINLLTEGDNEKNVSLLDPLLLSHLGHVISRIVRCWVSGLTGAHLIFSPVRHPVARYYRQLTRMSSALALLSDISIFLLGGQLKRKERISARLGDILSQLYLASAVLKYFNDQGRPATDLEYIKWCIQTCLADIQIACDDLLHNFPLSWLGKILRWILFPWGPSYHKPQDNLSHCITVPMLELSDLRKRLTQYCYISNHSHDTLQRIETALAQIQQVDPLWKKLKSAVRDSTIPAYEALDTQLQLAVVKKILTEHEKQTLQEFLALYQEIIKVNEFSFDLRSIVT
ncbi:MAG: fadE 1 [Gammaproteobacteria bacterium]|jgi:alkylation response protein AidB-like acyl-CoA dehydrogenase|nr:fadE 1 [Gammaproteobacteria bacterium]